MNLTYNSVIKTDGHFSLTKQSQCFPTRLEKSSLFFSQQAWTRRWRMSHPYTVMHLLDSKKFLLLKAKRLEKVSLTLLYLIKALHSLCLQIRPPVSPVLWPQSTIWHSMSLLSCYFFPGHIFFPFHLPLLFWRLNSWLVTDLMSYDKRLYHHCRLFTPLHPGKWFLIAAKYWLTGSAEGVRQCLSRSSQL